MPIILTREQAYELAWSAPLTTLAPEVGQSNVMLGRVLREAGIPLPGVGYWAKLAAGKPVKHAALSSPHLGTPRYVWIGGTESRQFLARVSGRPGEREQPWEDIEELAARFEKQIPSLRMPKDWQHEQVAKLLARDERTRQKAADMDAMFARFYRPTYDEPSAKRRLSFANRLGFALLRVGGSLSFSDKDSMSFSARIGSSHVSFSLEAVDGKLRLTTSERRAPTGPNQWVDDATGRLETRIAQLLVGLARAAVLWERQWREEIRRNREREEAARAELSAQRSADEARAKIKAQRQREKKLTKGLIKAARGAQESQLIRDYVVKAQGPLLETYQTDHVEAWAQQSLAIADKLDPWKNGRLAKSIERLVRGDLDEQASGSVHPDSNDR